MGRREPGGAEGGAAPAVGAAGERGAVTPPLGETSGAEGRGQLGTGFPAPGDAGRCVALCRPRGQRLARAPAVPGPQLQVKAYCGSHPSCLPAAPGEVCPPEFAGDKVSPGSPRTQGSAEVARGCTLPAGQPEGWAPPPGLWGKATSARRCGVGGGSGGAHRGGGSGHPSFPRAPGWEGAGGVCEGVQPQHNASGGNPWHAGGGEGSVSRARVPSSHLCYWPAFRCLGDPRLLANPKLRTFISVENVCRVYKSIYDYLIWEGPLGFRGNACTCFTGFRWNTRVWVVGVTGREGILAYCEPCGHWVFGPPRKPSSHFPDTSQVSKGDYFRSPQRPPIGYSWVGPGEGQHLCLPAFGSLTSAGVPVFTCAKSWRLTTSSAH